MIDRRILFTEQGTLRATWRIVLFCFLSAACLVVADSVFSPAIALVSRTARVSGVATAPWIECAAFLGATWLALRWVEKRPWSDVRLGATAAAPTRLVQGFLIGGAAIGLPVLALIGMGWLRHAPGAAGSWAPSAARVTLLLLPAALAEELLTHGYIFSVLRASWGWKWALGATSVAFGLLHFRNTGANLESLVLVMLAGVFLGAVLVATDSLYAAWMAHVGWNWTLAVVFHTAVSGYPLESPGYRYVDAGPDWATGGAWGPEGGLPAGIGMGLGSGGAYLFSRRRRSARRDTD